jgi:hypothetical protein
VVKSRELRLGESDMLNYYFFVVGANSMLNVTTTYNLFSSKLALFYC